MKGMFFPRLAWSGIKNNRKLYIPYILSCVGMVMMFYIVHSLSYSPLLREMMGGRTLEMFLSLGKIVIALFSLFFLFYTNSFLVRRRLKEFGLYSILGVGKRGLVSLSLCESAIVSVIGLTGGIGAGILFSKCAELGLLNIIHEEVDYTFRITTDGILFSVGIFAAIFALLAVKSIIDVLRLNPLELLRSENYGERPIKANWLFAVVGAALLCGAYYISVTIESPIEAIFMFFIAVMMVIAATYLLFISGSVALCKLLQRNKKYYYKKQHFVSVSSMIYRMKRNGAGLASICILSTMVLVMISFTSSFYFCSDDAIRAQYPQDNFISLNVPNFDKWTEENTATARERFGEEFAAHGVTATEIVDYRYAITFGLLDCDYAHLNVDSYEFTIDSSKVHAFVFMSVDDYNDIMNANCTVEDGEALIYPVDSPFGESTITFESGLEYRIAGVLDEFPTLSDTMIGPYPTIFFLVNDFDVLEPLTTVCNYNGDVLMHLKYYYGYNTDADDELEIELFYAMRDIVREEVEFIKDEDGGCGYSSACMARDVKDFRSESGGLFFIAIMLSIVFVFAEVMIIYYKQISEGYEDRARFDIMQKVGMTKADIKKSVNSQVLTVFFAPLIMAGLHLVFSMPMLILLLRLLSIANMALSMIVAAISFAVFGVLYALIYKLTARSYYSIVSD